MLSADCQTIDPNLKIEVEDCQLPAKHGTEIKYHCPHKHAKKGRNIKAVCHNGQIKISAAHAGSFACSKIGSVYM